MSEILIGTSGYDHPELKGSFYPFDLPRKDFLPFYATRFNALELNSSFYGMPSKERLLSLYERTEGRIKITVKMTRVLTHEIDGRWKKNAEEFKTAVIALMEKNVLATALIQFPESFGYSEPNRFYLSSLLKEMEPVPCVVEFRHRDWIRDSVFAGLDSRKTGIVFCDMPQVKNLPNGFLCDTPFIGTNAYIRLHGRNQNGWYAKTAYGEETHRYDYEYSEDELRSFIPIIRKAQEEGRQVQLYFNNHPKGVGFNNALQLKKMIESENMNNQ